MGNQITFQDFEKVDIRVGKVIDVQPFPKARNPAWKLWIDFGDALGIKKSSAQITVHYSAEDLMGRHVLAVTNFPPRQIADFMSECLTLGVYDTENAVCLLGVDGSVPLGAKVC